MFALKFFSYTYSTATFYFIYYAHCFLLFKLISQPVPNGQFLTLLPNIQIFNQASKGNDILEEQNLSYVSSICNGKQIWEIHITTKVSTELDSSISRTVKGTRRAIPKEKFAMVTSCLLWMFWNM